MSDVSDDLSPLIPQDVVLPLDPLPVKVYKRRWWILFIFAGCGFMQCSIWNTWGPITSSVKAAYSTWTNASIALLSMWGVATMLAGLVPFTLLLLKKGLRVSVLFTTALMAIGTMLRLFTSEETYFTVSAHMCAILNGFAGIVIGAAPSFLSSTWFPPHERTTATAIGCTFNQLGNAGGFFLGPWIVKDIDNSSVPANSTGHNDPEVEKIRQSFGICCTLFIFTLAYFPNKPRRPPSLTSGIQDTTVPFLLSLQSVFRNGDLMLLVIPYSLTLGINVAWSSVLDINVAPFGISQLFISVIIGASFNYACSPLFFELACELAYPVPEGIVGGFLTFCWNVVAGIFLLVMQTGMKSVIWMDYVLAGQGLAVVILMTFVREQYRRSAVDKVGLTTAAQDTLSE